MSTDMNKINELARKIYDFDEEAYKLSGSQLGRLYTGNAEHNIARLTSLLTEKPDSHEMRSDLALIGNMARTVPDKAKKKELMRKYNEIIQAVRAIDNSGAGDIKDPYFVELNESAIGGKAKQGDHLIICINSTAGSGGTEIGFALADTLHINYYDSDVLADVFERQLQENMKLDEKYDSVKQDLRNHPLLQNKTVQQLSRNHGLPKQDAEFFNASALIKELAKTEDFVIVGRCADVILQNNQIPYTSVFITAPVLPRAKRIMEIRGLSFKEASKRLVRNDKKRSQYYRFYTGRIWGHSTNYDLCINSARYGIQEAVQLILRVIGRDK